MGRMQKTETTIGPLAFDGRTITLVARTTAFHIGNDARGAIHVRSRPRQVEVLDEDGQRQVLVVRDIERALLVAVAIAVVAGTSAVRSIRRSRTRRTY
jgi:hypothetical protein